ncbi:MAG: MATE family efflux transporter [Burkholderiaceae bacterium]|nr:MATE family efflux transporter [Rhodoferax sp.]MCB2006961.1 MATE family efflux transporter [Rhodoferax sp.]MCB2029784.1 MATE family efflux transporter [Rhodoferax sp.]MCB2042653.1 MATE family efflux transporter [Rhodoferax sp.]MCP5263563.1 MATE family efflux transporter [Rhodoferax sp.]
MQKPADGAAASQGRLVTGSTLGHVIRMTAAGSIGLVAVFAVDALNLFYITLLRQPELTAALGYATTLLFLATSMSIGLSIAATALTARALGRGQPAQARQIAGASLIIVGTCMALLALACYPLIDPAMELLGARGQTAERAATLMRIILPSWPLLGVGMCLSGLLRATGDARRAMYVTLGAAATALVMDPLLILGLGLELHGVAIATIIVRVAMVVIGLHGLWRVHKLVARPHVTLVLRELAPFMAIAMPAVLTQIATPVGNAFVTEAISSYGDEAIAGWTVIQRIIPVAFGVLFALSGAIGPIVGQNFGARRFDRVTSTVHDALKVTLVYALAVWILLAVGSGLIADLFQSHGLARELIVFFCIFVAGSFLFNGALFVANAAFNNLGFAFYSTALNWGRSTLGVIPFVWLGQSWFGAKGALAGYGLGVIAFGVIGMWWCFRVVGKMRDGGGTAPTRAPH